MIEGDKNYFQLNICGKVNNFTCSSPLCEMSPNGQMNRTIFPRNDYTTSLSFDERSNVLSLKYKNKNQEVLMDFLCMEHEPDEGPEITFVKNIKSGNKTNPLETFLFKVRTRHVCMHPTTSCELEDPISGVTYDLSRLMTSEEQPNWIALDTRSGFSNQRYHISVCKPLSPSSIEYDLIDSRTAINLFDPKQFEG